MLLYQTDDAGYWTGQEIEARLSPEDEGVYLIPRGCVAPVPPALAAGERALWSWGTESWSVITAPEPPEPTPDELMRIGANQIQAHLDATARVRNYDSIHTAVSYRDDPNPVFAAEAEALFTWRSAVWTAGLAIMSDVLAELRPPPSEADLLAELPPIVWPS